MEKAGVAATGAMRFLLVPYEFCSLNAAAVAAFRLYATGQAKATWDKAT